MPEFATRGIMGEHFQNLMQCFQGNRTGRAPFGLMHFCRPWLKSHRMSFFFFCWKRAKTDRRDGSSMTRRNWDSELKERQISKNEAHRKSELCQLQVLGLFQTGRRVM